MELMTVTGYEKGIAGHEVVAIFDNIKVLKPTGNAQYQGFQILMSGKGCRNYENFLQLNEETWFDFSGKSLQIPGEFSEDRLGNRRYKALSVYPGIDSSEKRGADI